ncbi:MAG: hypothetical protein ACFB10_04435 [Salibacteraceae bacterium]
MKIFFFSAILLASVLTTTVIAAQSPTTADPTNSTLLPADTNQTLEVENNTLPEMAESLQKMGMVVGQLNNKLVALEAVAVRLRTLAAEMERASEAIPLDELESTSNALNQNLAQ